MTISSTRNHSAPPLPPRNNPAQTHASQASGKVEDTAGKQQGTTQTAGSSGHVHTPAASAPQDTFAVSSPNAHAGVTGAARPTKPQATGNVQASAQTQQVGDGPLAPDRAAAVLSFVNQQQGELLGRIAGGLKSGKISPEELGPLMQSAQKLAQASGEAAAKEQFMPNDTKNLSEMLMQHQATVINTLDSKQSIFSFFKKPSAAQQALAQQVGQLSQDVLQGRVSDGDLSKLVAQQFGSPAGAGPAVSQHPPAGTTGPSAGAGPAVSHSPVAGTGGVGETGAPPAPPATLQSMGNMVHQFGQMMGLLSAHAPQTPTPAHASVPAQAHASVPAQVQHVGNSLSFAPDASTMSNLSQQHGALQTKLDKLEKLNQGLNKARIALETLGSLKQGLHELGDAIKTTSAKEKITPADLLGLSTLVLKNATNIDHAFQVFKQS